MSPCKTAPSRFTVWCKGCKNLQQVKRPSSLTQQLGYLSLFLDFVYIMPSGQCAFMQDLEVKNNHCRVTLCVWTCVCVCSAWSHQWLLQDEGRQRHEDYPGSYPVCCSCCHFLQHTHHIQVSVVRIMNYEYANSLHVAVESVPPLPNVKVACK